MHRPSSPTDRLRTWASLALAAGLFATVGWAAMQPSDPLGAMSFVGHHRPIQTLAVGLALAVVAALLGEMLAGSRIAHFGVFTACFGLSALSLRGGSMRDLLLRFDTTDNAVSSRLHMHLAGEALLWSAVVLVSCLASAWIVRWLRTDGDRRPDTVGATGGGGSRKPVDGVRPTRSKPTAPPRSSRAAHLRDGLGALVAVTALAMLVIRVTAAGSPVDPIRTGQVFFSVGAGFLVATWLAVQIFPNATFAWIVPAVPVVAIAGYLAATSSAGFSDDFLPYNDVLAIPPNAFSRALPVEHVAAGILGLLLGLWSGRKDDAGTAGEQ